MDRRNFLKNSTQLSMALTVGRALSADATVTGSEQVTKTGSQQKSVTGVGYWGRSIAGMLVSLDGEWSLSIDPNNVGRTEEWYKGQLPQAKLAWVPSVIQEVFPGYHGVVWYGHNFSAPLNPYLQGRRLLRFKAVDYLADVWLNGVHVGDHEGADTPFVLDVTGAIKPNESNWLVVRVLNPSDVRIDGIVLDETPHRNKRMKYVPGNSFNSGGIVDAVDLMAVPGVWIENLYVRPDSKTGVVRIQINVRNQLQKSSRVRLGFTMAASATGEAISAAEAERELPSGDSLIESQLMVDNPRLWDLNDPYLYLVKVKVEAEGSQSLHETSIRCGFRDFRVINGYFQLNGKRLFLRSTHTGNHVPIGIVRAPYQAPDLLRRDLLYAKSSGFNMVRFISGMAFPYQLDLCDEIGLMVYEESLAAWLLADSPQMGERFDRSIREMIIRDRNHPSLTVWGLLNETFDGPVFQHAVSTLPLVRSLDETRLVLLSSGRWDNHPEIGSVSNPGSSEWEHVWGRELPGAAPGPKPRKDWMLESLGVALGGYVEGAGDAHVYPFYGLPQTQTVSHFIRTIGHGTKPVFLSEYGIGSLLNAIRETRLYEQVEANPELEDFALIRSMAERLSSDWSRFGMDDVYSFPEDMLLESQRLMARQRRLGFDVIRSNPNICGYNLTGMLDHALTGEGPWTFWREWKPAIMEALQDGWAPLRWCLFAEPMHVYRGQPVRLEAVLANEDVLGHGDYPARFRVMGPAGVGWEQEARVTIPQVAAGEYSPFAVPVLAEEARLNGPPGAYIFTANMEHGGGPFGRSLKFYISDAAALPQPAQTVKLWGIDEKARGWLESHGVHCETFNDSLTQNNHLIVVGNKIIEDSNSWKELARQIASGSVAIFLSPRAFQRDKDPVGWLPLEKKGTVYRFNDWLYHKECVAKPHPIFDGLQIKGIMDGDYCGSVVPEYLFDGQETPDDVAAAAFAVGYPIPGGYASGLLIASYPFGEGRFILNTCKILENLEVNPVADRLLLNMINYALKFVSKQKAEHSSNLDDKLRRIAYAQ